MRAVIAFLRALRHPVRDPRPTALVDCTVSHATYDRLLAAAEADRLLFAATAGLLREPPAP